MLTPAERKQTIASIAELQLDNGMIEWFPGGHADPWNHVEAAMALAVGGYRDQADLAYRWLASLQHDDGSWCSYYLSGDAVEDPRRDTNVTLYVATGLWHHLRIFEDRAFIAEMFPMVERAVEFALSLQQPSGVLLWSLEPPAYGLLTGSSSAAFSLRCAIGLAESIGAARPAWRTATARLAHAVAHRPDAFEPKEPWAMDWYYPVLCGAVAGAAGRARLAQRWDEFTRDGRGVRCVSDSAWITAAETAECSLSHLAVGERAKAEWLLEATRTHRDVDGSYWTGIALGEPGEPEVFFPDNERSSYTAAAIVLADDALREESPAWDLFVGDELLPGFACT